MAVTYTKSDTEEEWLTTNGQSVSLSRIEDGIANSSLHSLRFTFRGNESQINPKLNAHTSHKRVLSNSASPTN